MVRASGLRGYRSVMRDFGKDPIPLLHRYGMSTETLNNDEALVPLMSACALLEYSSKITNCPNLGLKISRRQDISVLGALGIAMQNTLTPMEALKIASRYLYIHSPGMRLNILEGSSEYDNAFEVSFILDLPAGVRQRQVIDLCLGTTFQISKLLNPTSFKLLSVSLPHSPLADISIYRKYFGASTQVNESIATLFISLEGWDIPNSEDHPALKTIVEDYLSQHFRSPTASTADRVRSLLRPLLGTERANREDIAGLLSVHPRTLHRRLKSEGTTFKLEKDKLRREMAMRYLEEMDVTLGQLSLMLGYPEQSSFTRACRKWFGNPPSYFRNNTL